MAAANGDRLFPLSICLCYMPPGFHRLIWFRRCTINLKLTGNARQYCSVDGIVALRGCDAFYSVWWRRWETMIKYQCCARPIRSICYLSLLHQWMKLPCTESQCRTRVFAGCWKLFRWSAAIFHDWLIDLVATQNHWSRLLCSPKEERMAVCQTAKTSSNVNNKDSHSVFLSNDTESRQGHGRSADRQLGKDNEDKQATMRCASNKFACSHACHW